MPDFESILTDLHSIELMGFDCEKEVMQYYDVQIQIRNRHAQIIRPFGLENIDGDVVLEELYQKSKNLLGSIRNFIIKLWTSLKELLDKAVHVFDSTLREMKRYQQRLKEGLKPKEGGIFFSTKVTTYSKEIFQKRIETLLREVSMRWLEVDGKPNMLEHRSLIDIGHVITEENGKVKYNYSGVYPTIDSIGGHGFNLENITAFLTAIIDLYEKFPNYKENMIRAYDSDIKARYDRSRTDDQKAETILADRASYIRLHKTVSTVLKEIRELGNEILILCRAIQ